MEPNKLENEFKKKLDQRTIQPSPMAWDRLDAMLSVAEEKKKPKRTWMYVAAGFLGFLLVGTLFFKQGTADSNGTVIKDTNSTVVNVSEDAVKKQSEKGAARTVETITSTPQAYVQQNEVAAVQQSKTSKRHKATIGVKEVNTAPVKLNDAVAADDNNSLREDMQTADSEKLLAQPLAQNEIQAKKTIRVNAKSLLSSVEGELDQNFKEKALQGAIKNFNAIKTSVANRNQK